MSVARLGYPFRAVPPTYKPKSQLRTRRSSHEDPAAPGADLEHALTSLDRPLIDDAALEALKHERARRAAAEPPRAAVDQARPPHAPAVHAPPPMPVAHAPAPVAARSRGGLAVMAALLTLALVAGVAFGAYLALAR